MALMVLTPLASGEIGKEHDTCPYCHFRFEVVVIGGYKRRHKKLKCPKCGKETTVYTSIK